VEIAASARKHGISEEDIVTATPEAAVEMASSADNARAAELAKRAAAFEEWAINVDTDELRPANTSALREIARLADMRADLDGRRADLDERLTQQVRAARVAGRTWPEIAVMLGVTKQAAHRKYARLCEPHG